MPKVRGERGEGIETEKKKKCYVSVNDMIRRLSISRTLAYQLANGGDLETVRIGRCLHVSE